MLNVSYPFTTEKPVPLCQTIQYFIWKPLDYKSRRSRIQCLRLPQSKPSWIGTNWIQFIPLHIISPVFSKPEKMKKALIWDTPLVIQLLAPCTSPDQAAHKNVLRHKASDLWPWWRVQLVVRLSHADGFGWNPGIIRLRLVVYHLCHLWGFMLLYTSQIGVEFQPSNSRSI